MPFIARKPGDVLSISAMDGTEYCTFLLSILVLTEIKWQ